MCDYWKCCEKCGKVIRILVIYTRALVINCAFTNKGCVSARDRKEQTREEGEEKEETREGIERRWSHHGVSTLLFVICKIN